jgi:HEXXH motif-containing protein
MRWAPVLHAISDSDLVALITGNLTSALVGNLTAAEAGKHRLLVEAVRRQAKKTQPKDSIFLDAAIQVLMDIETHSSLVVTDLLALPQIGGWAVHCLRRMRAGDASNAMYEAPLSTDLGYLASVAATAALRTGQFIDLPVPLRNSMLLFPGLGVAKLASDPWAIARVRLNSMGAVASLKDRSVMLPTGRDLESYRHIPSWTPISRLRVQAGSLALDVALDWLDPFLICVGEPVSALSARQLVAWELRLREAWQILVRHSRVTAHAFAASVSTFVPLAEPTSPDPKSATSGWTFGAIGLSLPGDAITLAEILLHEFQHLLLSAIEDLEPLVATDHDWQLGYAPWRDDPRPTAGLLHGSYAYLALTAFWRRQRRFGVQSERFRSAVEFARWRSTTFEVARSLADSPALTITGRKVATEICGRLDAWQSEPVTAKAGRLANDMRIEHRVRWRINNVRPADSAVDALAYAWLSGRPAVQEVGNITSVLKPSGTVLGQMRAFLLELRYRDPMQIHSLMNTGRLKGPLSKIVVSIDEADLALLLGDDSAAAHGYLQRLQTADDADALVGLAVALQGLGPPASAWILWERPEVVAAVHARLRAIHGAAPNTSRLVEWLAECFTPVDAEGNDIGA